MSLTVTDTRLRLSDGTLYVDLAGDWQLKDGIRDFHSDLAQGVGFSDARFISFDSSDLGAWDSSLLVFIQKIADYAEETQKTVAFDGLPKAVSDLITLARAVPEKKTRGDSVKEPYLERIGNFTYERLEHFGSFFHFSGTTIGSMFKLLGRTKKFRGREIWPVIQKTGPEALGLVALIAFMMGAILAFLGYFVLAQFGASIYVVYIVGYGILREMGPLMTAIIIAGRTGAAYAAEIGSMKASEELDAYETMGIDPVDVVIVPRLLALFIMMPFLTIYADAIGVFGGALISIVLSDLTIELFVDKFITDINLFQFGIGLFKGTLFGVVVGLSGCLRGMESGRSADAVGHATTSAVVTGITLIIATNFVIDFIITMMGL